MLRYIASRLLHGVVVLFALITIVFFLVRALPGDPFMGEKNVSEETKANIKKQFGLDRAAPIQYVYYVGNVLRGEFGFSTQKNRPVSDIISQAFPASLVLGIGALFVSVCIGIPLGILSAVKKNTWLDYGGMAIAMVGICIPAFVIGPLLQITVAMNVPFLSVAGWGSPADIILPSLTLGLGTAAYLARLTRGGMLEMLTQDFIRTARAKGVSPTAVVVKHALRGGLVPSIAFLGPAMAALVTGSFIVETIFKVPGMGQHFVNSVTKLDYFVLLGVVIFYGILIVVMNLVADVVTAMLNPRIRLGAEA